MTKTLTQDATSINFEQEISNYIFVSRYSRFNEKLGRRETWDEAVSRLETMHLKKFNYLSKEDKDEIKWAFDMVRAKRVVPSMRSLQFGGKAIEAHQARIFNCSVRHVDSIRSFAEIMYLLLCGCGVGIGVSRFFLRRLPDLVDAKDKTGTVVTYSIEDSMEGWADSVEALLMCYFKNTPYTGRKICFDYSKIRKKGTPLKTGGGKAPGYKGLKNTHLKIKALLDHIIENKKQLRLKSIDAYDILMHCADAVLSGGIRRSATSVIFDEDDEDMMNAKTSFKVTKKSGFEEDGTSVVGGKTYQLYNGKVTVDGLTYYVTLKEYEYEQLKKSGTISWMHIQPQRARSNNSILLLRDKITYEKFNEMVQRTRQWGEPGFVFANHPWTLLNPCFEIGFIPITDDGVCGTQFCNLTSINGKKITSFQDFKECGKAASLIGTLQAAYTYFSYLSQAAQEVSEQESLLGVSLTGWMDSPSVLLNEENQRKVSSLVVETNRIWAKKIGVNQAARTTCVKPEGCVSADTLILSNEGILYLDEVGDINGKEWQNHQINISSALDIKASDKFFVNGRKNVLKIKFNSGFEFTGTLNHKVQVVNSHGIEWKQLDNLQKGDAVVYRIGGYDSAFGSYQKLKKPSFVLHKNSHNTQEIICPPILDEELAWFLGLYLGDGSNHEKGIRISGNRKDVSDLDKANKIVNKYFGISFTTSNYQKDELDNRIQYYFNSIQLLKFLEENGLLKPKSQDIEIPKIVRQSPKSVIEFYLDGYAAADGCDESRTRSYHTVSEKMAKQLPIVLRAIGKDCKVRKYKPSKGSFGTNEKYWIQERKSLNGNINRNSRLDKKIYNILKASGYSSHLYDVVDNVVYGANEPTYDISVPDEHAYIANSFVSHNTSSLVLGTASGIHPHHSRRYFRRVQCNTEDNVYRHFKKTNPKLCEPSVWSANKTDDVITFPVTVSDEAMVKSDLSAIEHLEIIKSVQKNWVINGTTEANKKDLTHNVSCTVIVKDDEWDKVIDYLYLNREYFAAVSLLPETGDKDFPQAPMEAVITPEDEEHWEEIISNFKSVDYTKLKEEEDNTALSQEGSCYGGACQII